MSKLNKLPRGKGVYIWNHNDVLTGDVTKIIKELLVADVDFVCIKIQDGAWVYDGLENIINGCRNAGIKVGAFGYVYLNFDPAVEARTIRQAVAHYKPDFYLLDAEGHAKHQHANAEKFSYSMRNAPLDIPVGLNSYYRPDLHRELPWDDLLSVSDFVCPQVYWRNAYPIEKLRRSQAEYKVITDLPMLMVAGDMYYEHGMKPTPEQVELFIDACNQDQVIQSTVFWSLRQMHVVPDLWNAFCDTPWAEAVPTKPIEEPDLTQENFVTAVDGIIKAASEKLFDCPGYYFEEYMKGNLVEVASPVDMVINNAIAGLVFDDLPKPSMYKALVTAWAGLAVRKVRTTKNNKPLRWLFRNAPVTVWKEIEENGYVWAKIHEHEEEWVARKYLKQI